MFYVFLEDMGHQLHRKVNFYSKHKKVCVLVEKELFHRQTECTKQNRKKSPPDFEWRCLWKIG